MSGEFDMSFSTLADMIAAAGGLGTASFGVVDALKAFNGGVSNIGLKRIRATVNKFSSAFEKIQQSTVDEIITANWINGMPKSEQTATVVALIRLGLTISNANDLAKKTGINAERLAEAARHIEEGDTPHHRDLNILNQFGAVLSTIIGAAYEHADQQYRNASKIFAGIVSVFLAIFGTGIFSLCHPTGQTLDCTTWATSLLVGLTAVPLAPVAKDIASALQGVSSPAQLMRSQ